MKPHHASSAHNRRPILFQHAILMGLVAQILLFAAASFYYFPSQQPQLTVSKDASVERFLFQQQQHVISSLNHTSLSHTVSSVSTASVSPLSGLIRSHPNSPHHNPYEKRRCLAFTAVPKELDKLMDTIISILSNSRLASILDCIHLTIPDRSIRYSTNFYPTTQQLQQKCKDPRLIITRTSFDYGPMTRYLGPLHYERHAHSTMILFDVDTDLVQLLYTPQKDLALLFLAADLVDSQAMWCWQGENFYVDDQDTVHPAWDTYPLQQVTEFTRPSESNTNTSTTANTRSLAYNQCHFCRGVGGLAFKPVLHFQQFWWNQSDYHESCFWDDDRWVSYQMERQQYPLKVLHYNETIERLQQQQMGVSSSTNISRIWYNVAALGISRNVVPPSVAALEVPVETPEERRRKEESAQHKAQSSSNRIDRLKWRKQQAQLRQHQLEAQEALLNEERRKYELLVAGYHANNSSADNNADEKKNNVQSDNDASGESPADQDQSEDVADDDDKDASSNQRDKPDAMMHRRLGSLTQITNNLVSDQTCPLAWLSRHPGAYPSARTKRTNPHNIPAPPEDLTALRARMRLMRFGHGGASSLGHGTGGQRVANLLKHRNGNATPSINGAANVNATSPHHDGEVLMVGIFHHPDANVLPSNKTLGRGLRLRGGI